MIRGKQQQKQSEIIQFLKHFRTNKTQAELPLYDLQLFFFFFAFKPISDEKQKNIGKLKLNKNNQQITLKYIRSKLEQKRKDGYFLQKDLVNILDNPIDDKFLSIKKEDHQATFSTLEYIKEFIRPVANNQQMVKIQNMTQQDVNHQIMKQITNNFQSIISKLKN